MSSDSTAKGPRRNIRIGKYQVLEHIATGGMGAVYRARDTENGREVALKVLQPEVASNAALRERFRREGHHAQRLHHENIVTVYERGEANNTLFLAMEFVDGIDLHEYSQRKGPLDPEEARQIVLQAARGLQHAFEQGIVHRDVKPSNFLVTRQNGRLVVKLTDLGLAREQTGEEFRVTRAGTTVGTLDYMSPEQARDSGSADVRSDLYSLGGTWYHLLAGQAPFPKGGLAERLLKIMNSPPPDVRTFNPRVSAATWAVLLRLLEKEPEDRYQTPAELIEDLEALGGGSDSLSRREELAAVVGELPVKEVRSTGSRSGVKKRSPTQGSSKSDTKVDKPASRTPRPLPARRSALLWYSLGAAVALVLISSLVLVLLLRHPKPTEPAPSPPDSYLIAGPGTNSVDPTPSPPSPGPDKPPADPPPQVVPTPNPPKPSGSELPALYQPAAPFPVAELNKEIEAPWQRSALPAGEPLVLPVSRSPLAGGAASYLTLQDAVAATVPKRVCIIELHDNGPLLEASVQLTDRHVVIRPAKGFRPLLCWDVRRAPAERTTAESGSETPRPPEVFLDVRGGSLTLEDIELAVRWPDTSSEGAALFRTQDADLTLQRCSFSVAGRPRDGLTVVRFQSGRPEPAPRFRLSHCFVRGWRLTLLDLAAPGAEVLLDHSLCVCGERPFLQVHAGNDHGTNLRAVRSTFLAGTPFLTVQPARSEDRFPRLSWLGWDVLISRAGKDTRGELLQVSEGAGTDRMSWRAVNCLYAGWNVLMAGASSISADDINAWRRAWQRIEGDVVQPEAWPATLPSKVAEASATAFRTAQTAVEFAASANPNELLGCDLEHLPPARESWLPLTYDRFDAIPPPALEDDGPPSIEAGTDRLYHGEELDLNQYDLGSYLDQVQSSRRLASRVVLHLSGKGERSSSPLRFEGKHLVLYFKPAERGDKPLSVRFKASSGGKAVIEVPGGNLDIIGGTLRMTDAPRASAPSWFLEVGGNVHLLRCRLEGPQQHVPAEYQGLLFLAGSGQTSPTSANFCRTDECVLVSGRAGIAEKGLGARIYLSQTVLITGSNALELAPGPAFQGKANVQAQLERSTLAARGAVVRLSDMPENVFPTEPVIVQSRSCAFLNPFAGRGDHPGLLRYDGAALAHGLMAWQSDGDFYDRRLLFLALSTAGKYPEKPESIDSWLGLWGAAGVTRPLTDVRLIQSFTSERWSLEMLLTVQRSLGSRGANVLNLPGFRKSFPH